MNQKGVGGSIRLAVLIGLALATIALPETQRTIARALEFDPSLDRPSIASLLATIPLQKPVVEAQSAPQPQSDQTTAPKATTHSTTPASEVSDRQVSLAVNAEVVDSEQTVNQVDPQQIAAFSEWQGASFPVEDFQTYTSPFGYRMSPDGGYTQEFHYGLDMAAPEGSYIRNWWTGTVIEVSDDSNCGTSIVVQSGSWMHIYCHMSGYVDADDQGRYLIDRDGGLQIYEGQTVVAGQRIGRVGMTGRTTGPHLHWGLKYDENWVDPARVLLAMYDSQQQTAAVSNGN